MSHYPGLVLIFLTLEEGCHAELEYNRQQSTCSIILIRLMVKGEKKRIYCWNERKRNYGRWVTDTCFLQLFPQITSCHPSLAAEIWFLFSVFVHLCVDVTLNSSSNFSWKSWFKMKNAVTEIPNSPCTTWWELPLMEGGANFGDLLPPILPNT